MRGSASGSAGVAERDGDGDGNEQRDTDQNGMDRLPFNLPLELNVQDADVIRALWAFPEGGPREEFGLRALRIGVLALQQAQGQIDATAVRQEGERLLSNIEGALRAHGQQLNDRLAGSLKEYFDPESGRFQERVERLIRQDGELEQLMRRHVGHDDSSLCRTLAVHLGQESPLMRVLDPEANDGVAAALRDMVEERLVEQRQRVLEQFSLDMPDGALCRFLKEVQQHYEGISGDLTGKIDKAVGEFSLDDENSALSRLVARVKLAQETITREFSLDQEESALSRMKRELIDLLDRQSKTNRDFQEEIKVAVADLKARKQEAARSTRHGITFEEQMYAFIEQDALRCGDVAERIGSRTGLIKQCKKGDVVLSLGPDSAAADARIVIESKKVTGYSLKDALAEIGVARSNRGAQIGIFVFSRDACPEGLEPLTRFGSDIVVQWSDEDPGHDIYLRIALTLARALCVREHRQNAAQAADLEQIDRAVLEIEKRAGQLDEIKSSAESIIKTCEKILNRQRLIRQALEGEVSTLRDKTQQLRVVSGDAL